MANAPGDTGEIQWRLLEPAGVCVDVHSDAIVAFRSCPACHRRDASTKTACEGVGSAQGSRQG